MKAWDTVRVSNPEHPYTGQAGFVVTSVTKGRKETVTVQMDSDTQQVEFDSTELELLKAS